eukprot:TRINITY_DN809_c1_g1_i1.p1 TRINITY_DN809_c1_g1~~TRINITY_DN809_c1_g1_i1.p1  ORF type:complete len:648 (+),score=224.10 TRINITY_DN809_c1_g1_i1:192-2135(+)
MQIRSVVSEERHPPAFSVSTLLQQALSQTSTNGMQAKNQNANINENYNVPLTQPFCNCIKPVITTTRVCGTNNAFQTCNTCHRSYQPRTPHNNNNTLNVGGAPVQNSLNGIPILSYTANQPTFPSSLAQLPHLPQQDSNIIKPKTVNAIPQTQNQQKPTEENQTQFKRYDKPQNLFHQNLDANTVNNRTTSNCQDITNVKPQIVNNNHNSHPTTQQSNSKSSTHNHSNTTNINSKMKYTNDHHPGSESTPQNMHSTPSPTKPEITTPTNSTPIIKPTPISTNPNSKNSSSNLKRKRTSPTPSDSNSNSNQNQSKQKSNSAKRSKTSHSSSPNNSSNAKHIKEENSTSSASGKEDYYCKYCEKSWPFSHFRNAQQFGAHCSNCSRKRKVKEPQQFTTRERNGRGNRGKNTSNKKHNNSVHAEDIKPKDQDYDEEEELSNDREEEENNNEEEMNDNDQEEEEEEEEEEEVEIGGKETKQKQKDKDKDKDKDKMEEDEKEIGEIGNLLAVMSDEMIKRNQEPHTIKDNSNLHDNVKPSSTGSEGKVQKEVMEVLRIRSEVMIEEMIKQMNNSMNKIQDEMNVRMESGGRMKGEAKGEGIGGGEWEKNFEGLKKDMEREIGRLREQWERKLKELERGFKNDLMRSEQKLGL